MRKPMGPLGPVLSLCLLSGSVAALPLGAPVFINEFHYDNAGGDVGEFVELAGRAGTDIDGWSLVFYNGGSGDPYRTVGLSGVLGDDTGTGFGFHLIEVAGIQNGSPDGLALVDAGDSLLSFLSYEGTFVAGSGPAAGVASDDIGVSESGGTAVGTSLQLFGAGNTSWHFDWQAGLGATPGALNHDQLLFDEAVGEVPEPGWLVWLPGLWWLVGRAGPGRRRSVP